MSNLDNQPGRDDRTGFSNQTPNDRTGLDNRKTGMGAGTIAAILGAVLIVGGLMLFGSWGDNRTAVINSPTATTGNSTAGTTTGQTSGAPRVITPNVAPATPTTPPAPATTR